MAGVMTDLVTDPGLSYVSSFKERWKRPTKPQFLDLVARENLDTILPGV